MFLVRTERTATCTADAQAALSHLRAMLADGQKAVVTTLGGRSLSQADLQRAAAAATIRAPH